MPARSLAMPAGPHADNLGSVYAEKPEAFDDLDVGIGVIFGPFAALSLQSALYEQEAASI